MLSGDFDRQGQVCYECYSTLLYDFLTIDSSVNETDRLISPRILVDFQFLLAVMAYGRMVNLFFLSFPLKIMHSLYLCQIQKNYSKCYIPHVEYNQILLNLI